MKALLLSGALFVSSISAADGIRCYDDARPRDGVYREVSLTPADKGYNVTLTTTTPGWGAPATTTTQVLANNLSCNISGLLAYCFKSSLDDNIFMQNSWVTFVAVEKTSILSLTTPPEQLPARIEIEVGSPLVDEVQLFSFAQQTIFGKCEAI